MGKVDSFDVTRYQHDDCYIDVRSQIKVHTDQRTQVHCARSFLTVAHLGRENIDRIVIKVY